MRRIERGRVALKETDPLPSRLQPFANLERRASLIRTYDTQYIPGLLQTPQYAQAVIRSGRLWAPPAEIEQRLQLRSERQRILRESSRTRLWAIIHESVLHAELAGQPGRTLNILRGMLHGP